MTDYQNAQLKSPSNTAVQARAVQAADAGLASSISWFKAGFDDMVAAPALSLGIGAAVAAIAAGARALSEALPLLTLPSIGVMVLIAPFALATLISVARQSDRKRQLGRLKTALLEVRGNALAIGTFALLLGLLFVAGVRITALVFALLVGPTVPVSLLEAPLDAGGPAYLALIGGGIVFGIAALVLTAFGVAVAHSERKDAVTSLVRGLTLAKYNLRPMIVWCLFAAALALSAVLLTPLALIIGVPLLGFANWHGFVRASRELDRAWQA